jgi:hypothetical protein
MKTAKLLLAALVITAVFSCKTNQKNGVPVVGFVDAFEDATISQAKDGFVAALKDNGFSEDKKNIEIKYSNAQGKHPYAYYDCKSIRIRKGGFTGDFNHLIHRNGYPKNKNHPHLPDGIAHTRKDEGGRCKRERPRKFVRHHGGVKLY